MAYASALGVLADSTRRRLVERLATGPKSASELARGFEMSRPAVSQHLRALREAELVRVEKAGARRIYHLQPQSLGELRAYLDGMWSDILANLEEPAG